MVRFSVGSSVFFFTILLTKVFSSTTLSGLIDLFGQNNIVDVLLHHYAGHKLPQHVSSLWLVFVGSHLVCLGSARPPSSPTPSTLTLTPSTPTHPDSFHTHPIHPLHPHPHPPHPPHLSTHQTPQPPQHAHPSILATHTPTSTLPGTGRAHAETDGLALKSDPNLSQIRYQTPTLNCTTDISNIEGI